MFIPCCRLASWIRTKLWIWLELSSGLRLRARYGCFVLRDQVTVQSRQSIIKLSRLECNDLRNGITVRIGFVFSAPIALSNDLCSVTLCTGLLRS